MATKPPTRPAQKPEQPTMSPSPETFAKTIPFIYERHSFGEHKKTSMARIEVTTTEEETKPDKGYLSLQKRLIESPALNAIRHCDARFRNYLKNEAATPWRPGLYLVPVGLIGQVDERARLFEKERAALADSAAEVYEEQVKLMPAKLGPLFNPQDYPTKERFRATFWLSWRFIDMGVPAGLKTIKAKVFERERQKAEAEWRRAQVLIQQHLRITLLEITDHLSNLLAPKADGKFKSLRDDALTDLIQFLDSEPLRNTTNDVDLKRFVGRLKAMGGKAKFDVEILRDDDALRTEMATEMEKVKVELATMVVARTRGIRVRDEEEE